MMALLDRAAERTEQQLERALLEQHAAAALRSTLAAAVALPSPVLTDAAQALLGVRAGYIAAAVRAAVFSVGC